MTGQRASTVECDVPPLGWPERNREVVGLGLAWLAALLAGDDSAAAARKTYEQARAAMLRSGAPAAIDSLARLFDLAPFDEDVLLLAFARHIDPAFTAPGAQPLTSALAMSLLVPADFEATSAAQARLSPLAPLRRYALIGSSDARFAVRATLAIEERVARHLLGETLLDGAARPLLTPSAAGPCPPAIRPLVRPFAETIAAAPRPAALLVGARRSGRRAVARALAESFDLALLELKSWLLPQDIEARRAILPTVAREAVLGGFALLVDLDRAGAAEELLDTLDAFVIAIAEQPPEVIPATPQLRLPALVAADRALLWRQALGDAPVPADQLDMVSEHFRLGPDDISAIAATVRDQHGEGLWLACRETARRGLDALAERIVPRFGWDEIMLPDAVRHDLRAIAAQVRHRAAVYERGGFGGKLASGRGVTALFAGPSGVGKTMAAEVIAHDLDLDLYRVDLSSVISKYIGETEQNLKRVFDAAEASGALLFFDEADALFGKRSEVKDSHDRYANIEVSYLLQRMESYSGLAILATNLKAHIDAAFLRRLRFVIDVPFPDASQRRAIWAGAFPPETRTEGLDLDALARIDIAGGNIVVIAVNAAFLAAADGGAVTMAHIARAARAELRKLDKDFRPTWLPLETAP
ncbi:ATP-binding protein [Sphingomonas quercus]|uniref:ATP-binding protein n=1 Tax=Sphingomonas quercus TaxID=2842451 RepID=A0ABS6BP61_9SPHN|nr:ATP-binding protein [Sphingomonas quercus]MBU3079000.1 ATP-binding protein [Sphingomonas quercus]